ncbi:MAG: D-glycerate dehydrogenase [Acidobacteria bacterium]|nr:D-glycerate dehydrogenase [Acidobacteriota bacterium]MBV9925282.1 D-glycerate dehydrogenase [Acidobacteriota bacterium]
MKYTVVLTAEYPSVARDLLAGEFDVIEHPTEVERSEDDLITLLDEADAAITLLSDPLTRRVLEASPNLRMIANYAVGYNNVDVEAARELGIRVTNTPGVLTEATAELTMTLLLAVLRRVVEGDAEVRSTGRCIWEPLHLLGESAFGKTLGIVGLGRIGSAVAERARAFGMNVIGVRRGEPLDEVLATADILSIHVPLTAETRHLIDRNALQKMKRGAYLVNTARGPIVDENALCDALESGQLRGAGLDVYEHEPGVNPRLLAMRNVVLLPHVGSATEETRGAMARIAATDVARFLRGQPPLHVVV